jgi:putative SOS response-associated peptidase YedK
MCFTVNLNLIKEELENRYGATLIDPDRYRPSYYYHAFSLPEIPAICSTDPGKIKLLRWGLIPSWTRSTEDANIIRYKTFNARAETIDKKPSFSSAFRSRRCIIPVKGFFEWQHAGKVRIPWYICHYDDEILSLAGLFEEWTESSTGRILSTFSVITTEANEMMAEIHNSAKRMPAILDRDSEAGWNDRSAKPADLSGFLRPCPSEMLKAHTISPLINDRNANRNTPDLIKPYSYEKGNSLSL